MRGVRKTRAEYSRIARARALAAGLCGQCAKQPATAGRTMCEHCAQRYRTRMAAWRAANPDYFAAYQRAKTTRLRAQVLEHYGASCACCGLDHEPVLCIDHINGGGGRERAALGVHGGQSFYSWLKRNGWPAGYQTLCHNCNIARHRSGAGVCPIHTH